MIRHKQNFLSANWIAPADSIRNVFRLIGSSFVWLAKLGERTAQLRRDNNRRVRTHEKNSAETVRRLGTIIQSTFCAQLGASILLTVWKWSCKSQYPGALPPLLENFGRTLSPGPTDCPWVSEDGWESTHISKIYGSTSHPSPGNILHQASSFDVQNYDKASIFTKFYAIIRQL